MSATITSKPLRVFISYTHSDEKLKDELGAHLAPLRQNKLIEDWHDRKIGAGQEWKNAIDANLERSHIILLLISARFLNSSYCMDIEMKRALERHDEGKARVIPVILRPCNWHSSPFSKLQAVPTDGRPVLKWRSHDEAWTVVAKEIEAAAKQFRSSTPAMRRKQNKSATVDTAAPVTPSKAVKSQRPTPTKQRIPAAPNQTSSRKVGQARAPKPTTALPAPTTAVDTAPLIKRARSLVVNERNAYYGDGSLQVIVVGGPLQKVLRPAQIEAGSLEHDLEQQALYGAASILTRGEKVVSKVEKGVLSIAQQESSLSLTEDGALAIVQPARRRAGNDRLGMSALIEEDVIEAIERSLRFAGIVLKTIDRVKHLTALVVAVALNGVGYTPWRTRAEHPTSPNSGFMGRGVDHIVVDLGRSIPRDSLSRQIPEAAKDLMILVRREVKG